MTGARILVVDDEPGMLRAVDRVLAPAHQTLCLGSAAEALARAPDFEPDLALLDVRMGDASGFDVMDRLRERCPGLDVIFMTGSAEETDATHVTAIVKKAFYFIQKPFDRRVLLTLVERCLELRRLSAENRRHVARLESELAGARAFQQSLLPPQEASMGGIRVSARYVPSTELGGDLFAYAEAGEGRVALLVADVAGHGASAAMLTGIVKSAFDSSQAEHCDPASAVRRVADGLRNFDPRKFVTLFAARADIRRGTLDYVNAGHPPGVVWGPGRPLRLLDATGLIVSPVFSDHDRASARVTISRGDRLLLFTDGLLELERGAEIFGRERILAAVSRVPGGGAPLLDALLDEARAFGGLPARDDITLLTASF